MTYSVQSSCSGTSLLKITYKYVYSAFPQFPRSFVSRDIQKCSFISLCRECTVLFLLNNAKFHCSWTNFLVNIFVLPICISVQCSIIFTFYFLNAHLSFSIIIAPAIPKLQASFLQQSRYIPNTPKFNVLIRRILWS